MNRLVPMVTLCTEQVEIEDDDNIKSNILSDHITELQLILLAFLVEHSDVNPELVVSDI